ncbi:hypothetical protein ACH5RR_000761 [Cinchona calisaya]|uniref:Sialate O-acetylesterase domain-containing protein n=1 Tax=Cinchona calisaya TaxID=153742 RepID=A0ABD3B223_9GENT
MSIVLLSTLLAFASFSTSQSQPQNIFLLAGESNIVGQGGVVNNKWDGVVPPESGPNPAVQRLNAKLEWEEAKEPLHSGLNTGVVNGIGPGIPFGIGVFGDNPRLNVIGLVPSGVSGTKIIDWQKGTKAYNQLITRAQAANKSGGFIQALVWYQGESDTVLKADADAYKGRFNQFIKDLRADLDSPFLVILEVALASGIGNFTEEVRQAQLKSGIHDVRVVDAKGLELEKDKVHLTTRAQVRLGEKLAEAFR